jgi:hypothetical protein
MCGSDAPILTEALSRTVSTTEAMCHFIASAIRSLTVELCWPDCRVVCGFRGQRCEREAAAVCVFSASEA